jgi:hypothetical protein
MRWSYTFSYVPSREVGVVKTNIPEVIIMKKALAVVVFVTIAFVFIAIGCQRKEDSKDKYRIAVIPKGMTHVFWKSIHAGSLKAGQELKDSGLEVEVIWKGPLKDFVLWYSFSDNRQWTKQRRLHEFCCDG